jgi:hypothetical protein
LRNPKRFPVALRWAGRPGRSGAIDSEPGDQALERKNKTGVERIVVLVLRGGCAAGLDEEAAIDCRYLTKRSHSSALCAAVNQIRDVTMTHLLTS